MGTGPRTGALDGLRGLAALSVVAFHVWLYRPDRVPGTRTGLGDHFFFEMHLGLICFFVLSGFLLYRGLLRRPDFKPYAVRRIARIVPAYYVSIAGCLVLFAVLGLDDLIPPTSSLPLFLAFGQNYFSDTLMEINPVTWTLCVEAAFYLLLPLIGWCAWRVGPSRWGRQALLVASLFPIGVVWNQIAHDNGWNIILTKMLPPFLPYFACGMLLALWSERRRSLGLGALGRWVSVALVLGGFVVVAGDAYWHETGGPRAANAPLAVFADIPAAAGFALVVCAAVAGSGWSVRWMRVRPLAWVGLVSYGVYMWHLPILLFMRRMDVWPSEFPARGLLLLAATLPVAALSWYVVERPLIEWAGRPRRREREREREPERAAKPRAARPSREPAFESHAAP